MIEDENNRHIDSFMSVFDLKIQTALNLEKRLSIRVRFSYDKNRDIRKFKILNYNMSDDLLQRIIAWLDKNAKDNNFIMNLADNKMNADIKMYN